jgi:hypothetical protein
VFRPTILYIKVDVWVWRDTCHSSVQPYTMSLPQETQLEFILPKHSHALPGRSWIPIPPTEIKFELVHSLWQYPGFLDAGRVKSALRMVLEDYPLWGARLAFVPLTGTAVDAEGLESGWRFDLNDTEGVQFSCVSTRHPGVFRPGYRDDDLHPGVCSA